MSIDFPLLIGVTINGMGLLYIMLKLNDVKIKDNILKTVLITILFGIYIYISYLISNNFIRYMTFLLFGSIVLSKSYKINIIPSLCATFFSWIVFLIAEITLTIVLIGILHQNVELYYGGLLGNILVTIIALIIFSIQKVQKIILYIVKKINNLKHIMIIILIFILALSFSIILYINSFHDKSATNFILSLIIIFTQITITFLLVIEKNNKQKIQYQYDSLINNLEEYEKMLDLQRISNHENKNQLLVIKGMIEKKDKDVEKYINSIIEEKNSVSESFLFHTNKIPSGGLRGLIYYKVLLMKDKKINVELNIDKSVRRIDFDKIGIDVNKDLCKIIGVMLDNAIEAVNDLKDKEILISLNYQNSLFKISIANNFFGSIDISNIDEKGYTTKGKGHGYGLSLVKEIISKNNRIENKREIKGNMFIQNIILNCEIS